MSRVFSPLTTGSRRPESSWLPWAASSGVGIDASKRGGSRQSSTWHQRSSLTRRRPGRPRRFECPRSSGPFRAGQAGVIGNGTDPGSGEVRGRDISPCMIRNRTGSLQRSSTRFPYHPRSGDESGRPSGNRTRAITGEVPSASFGVSHEHDQRIGFARREAFGTADAVRQPPMNGDVCEIKMGSVRSECAVGQNSRGCRAGGSTTLYAIRIGPKPGSPEA